MRPASDGAKAQPSTEKSRLQRRPMRWATSSKKAIALSSISKGEPTHLKVHLRKPIPGGEIAEQADESFAVDN